MAQTWASHGPPKWFFLNFNDSVPGCQTPNFRVLASILTDFSTFFKRKKGRKEERKLRTQDVELRICPKGKGGAN